MIHATPHATAQQSSYLPVIQKNQSAVYHFALDQPNLSDVLNLKDLTMPELMLYHFPSCPFCKVVMDCLERLKLDIPTRDIQSEAGARDELIEIGGKGQVPCLVIDGKPLYESADIVSWLEENSNK